MVELQFEPGPHDSTLNLALILGLQYEVINQQIWVIHRQDNNF